MIEPTVGRVVWYRPGKHEQAMNPAAFGGPQPLSAQIAYVHSDTMVNLMVADHNGTALSRTSVPLVQEGCPVPEGAYCEWMPYQKGQAAKTEQLEAQMSCGGGPSSAPPAPLAPTDKAA